MPPGCWTGCPVFADGAKLCIGTLSAGLWVSDEAYADPANGPYWSADHSSWTSAAGVRSSVVQPDEAT